MSKTVKENQMAKVKEPVFYCEECGRRLEVVRYEVGKVKKYDERTGKPKYSPHYAWLSCPNADTADSVSKRVFDILAAFNPVGSGNNIITHTHNFKVFLDKSGNWDFEVYRSYT